MRHILTQMIASILDSLAAILLRISLIYKCTANNILIYEMIEFKHKVAVIKNFSIVLKKG